MSVAGNLHSTGAQRHNLGLGDATLGEKSLMKARGSPLPSWASVSISRSLQVLAVVAVLLIVGGTTHRLLETRALIIGDTEQELSRLDMVFAEQTGRAIEGVDLS